VNVANVGVRVADASGEEDRRRLCGHARRKRVFFKLNLSAVFPSIHLLKRKKTRYQKHRPTWDNAYRQAVVKVRGQGLSPPCSDLSPLAINSMSVRRGTAVIASQLPLPRL